MFNGQSSRLSEPSLGNIFAKRRKRRNALKIKCPTLNFKFEATAAVHYSLKVQHVLQQLIDEACKRRSIKYNSVKFRILYYHYMWLTSYIQDDRHLLAARKVLHSNVRRMGYPRFVNQWACSKLYVFGFSWFNVIIPGQSEILQK